MNSLYLKAKQFALDVHKDQSYGNYRYSYHLQRGDDLLCEWLELYTHLDHDITRTLWWLHDTKEDHPKIVTVNLLTEMFGKEISDKVCLLSTDETKLTRKEKHSDEYYAGIAQYEDTTLVKIVDRTVNVGESVISKNSMLKRYISEQDKFKQHLYRDSLSEAFIYLEKIMSGERGYESRENRIRNLLGSFSGLLNITNEAFCNPDTNQLYKDEFIKMIPDAVATSRESLSKIVNML